MALKLPDSAVPMGDFPVAKAVDIDFDDGENLQEKLDNGALGGGNNSNTTVIFDESIDMGKYLLLAKITNANYANNIIKFSCPNFKGQNDVGFRYEDDMDMLKFELHFNTGATREANGYGVTLKQHGLGLYSYPLNNPKNTSPEIKDAIRLYWDYSKAEIYVFLVDLMTAIPHCVLEYTGNGTLLKENTFVDDSLYNRLDGLNATWEASKWKSIPYNKLETPPIHELGGDGGSGSAEGTTTYTSLDALGLTASATIQEVIDALPIGCTALLRTDAFTDWSTLFNGIKYGYLKIAKTVNGLCEIWLEDVTSSNKLYYGRQASGKFSEWVNVITANKITSDLTNSSTIDQIPNASLVGGEIHGKFIDPALYSDALAMPIGKWRVDSNNKASQMQNLPVSRAGILEVNYLQGSDGQTAYTGTFKYAMLTYTDIDGNKYGRSFNSDGTVGNIINDTGWKKTPSEDRVAELEADVNELFQSVSSGKTLVANAITGKGVSTSTTATFATMATNIGKISGGYKEETKSLIVTSNSNGIEALPFTFSANVIAVKQIVAPSDSCRIVPQTSKDMLTINGKELVLYVSGSGTWKITAMVSG